MKMPQLLRLSGEDMKKIFPENYYTKYATHLKVLEFEKIAIEEERRRHKVNFQFRKHATPEIPDKPPKTVKMNRYDDFEETIQKNKEELKRLNKYKAILDLKLRSSPSPKKDVIRSPTKMDKELDDQVLLRLKAVDDMQYEQQMKLMQKAKQQKDKQSICKFVYNNKSHGGSPRKNENPEYDLIMDRLNKETLAYHSSSTFTHRNMEKNSSFFNTNNNNSTLKVSNKDGILKRTLSNRNMTNASKMYSRAKKREKRDLVGETMAIREQVHSMKLIKRYDELMKTRAHNERLAAPL